jgi:hypothetical protein
VGSFVLRSAARGYDRLVSTGPNAAYVAGHPDAAITRHSCFNFHGYQSGRPGFGKIRVLGDETFSGAGCGYNMHPHHNFIIMAFVLQGSLTHINTIGKVDVLGPGEFYAFSAGSGGKHCELSIEQTDMRVVYLWVLPDVLMLPPTYLRAHFDATENRNRVVQLIGSETSALRIAQELIVSRRVGDRAERFAYTPKQAAHGVYVFVLDGVVTCGGTELRPGDSMGLCDMGAIDVATSSASSDALFIETAM